MRTRIVQSTIIALCVAQLSCILPSRAWYTLHVTVAPDANRRTPVPVDLVFVWDKATAAKVKGLTAVDWFTQKIQFRQDDPYERALTVCEWEWVPGQAVPEVNLSVPAATRQRARGVFLFANYRSEGPHRATIDPQMATMIFLGRDDLSLRSIGRDSARSFTLLDEACSRKSPL